MAIDNAETFKSIEFVYALSVRNVTLDCTTEQKQSENVIHLGAYGRCSDDRAYC